MDAERADSAGDQARGAAPRGDPSAIGGRNGSSAVGRRDEASAAGPRQDASAGARRSGPSAAGRGDAADVRRRVAGGAAFRVALCNEVLGALPLERQCALAAALGYDGLEIAPFTLGEAPERLSAGEAARIRGVVEDAGLVVTGLHWLLVVPAGLSVTTRDASVRRRTLDVVERLVALCAALGGRVLVHGSPKQRVVDAGESLDEARARLVDFLAAAAACAERAGVVYCIEPLPAAVTPLVHTVAEAAAIVREVGSPALRTMIDCHAAATSEAVGVGALLDAWLPTGLVAHVQANDPNGRGPGQGELAFAPIVEALVRQGYDGVVAVEPFEYVPDGAGAAAFAADYLRGIVAAAIESRAASTPGER